MSKRLIRDFIESSTSSVPNFWFVGDGTVLGGLGYYGATILNTVDPTGIINVGYTIESDSVELKPDGTELYTFNIHALSKDVAKYAARANSNLGHSDVIFRDKEITSVEKIKERSTYTTWRVKVGVEKRDFENLSV